MALKESTDTAVAAVKKPDFIGSYFKNGIVNNIKTLIVITILNLISFPVALISLTYDLHKSSAAGYAYYGGNSVWFIILAFLFTIVTTLSGVIIALNNFSYLYKKHNVDMYLSLPLKNSQRFLCDYFSGLVCYIGPFLLSGVITFIISLISMSIVPQISNGLTNNLDMAGLVLRGYLFMAVVMIMLYTLTVLTASVCGNYFETVFYTLLLNGLIPGMITVIVFIVLGNSFGLIYEDYITPLISKTSPIGAFIGLSLYAETHGEDSIWGWGFMVKYCLALLAVSALYMLVAYLLYKHRKAEDVSKPFVYSVFYYVIMAAIMLSMSAFVVLNAKAFAAPMIVFMIVVYLVFEVVNKRGFRKFRYSLMRCALTIVACIGFSMLCKSTNGFGISYRVPDAGDVKSVTLTYMGPDNLKEYYYYSYEDNLGENNSITVVDKDTIENITKAHKSIVEKYGKINDVDPTTNYGAPDTETTFVIMKYKLKNGTSMTREYAMTADEIYYLDAVCLDSNYESEMARVLENKLLNREMITVSNIYDSSIRDEFNPLDDEEYAFFKSAAKAIAQAYAKDLASRSIDQIRTPSQTPLAVLDADYDNTLYIYPWDTNVINTLKDYGFVDVYEIAGATPTMWPNNQIFIDMVYRYEAGEYSEDVTEYISVGCPGYYNYSDYHGVVCVIPDKEDLQRAQRLESELLDVAIPHYMTTEPLYKINVHGNVFIIPPEFTSVAKEFFDLSLYYSGSYADYYIYGAGL